jgi:hypothetical protein
MCDTQQSKIWCSFNSGVFDFPQTAKYIDWESLIDTCACLILVQAYTILMFFVVVGNCSKMGTRKLLSEKKKLISLLDIIIDFFYTYLYPLSPSLFM